MEEINDVINDRLSVYSKKAEMAYAAELQAMEKRQMKKIEDAMKVIEDGFFPRLHELEVKLEGKLHETIDKMPQLEANKESFDGKIEKLEAKIERTLSERMDRFEKKIEGTVFQIHAILNALVNKNTQ